MKLEDKIVLVDNVEQYNYIKEYFISSGYNLVNIDIQKPISYFPKVFYIEDGSIKICLDCNECKKCHLHKHKKLVGFKDLIRKEKFKILLENEY